MIDYQAVQDDLMASLTAVAPLQVVGPNERSRIQAGTNAIAASFEFARARMTDVNLTEAEVRGRFKVDIMTPQGAGVVDGNAIAKQIMTAFPTGIMKTEVYQIIIESVYVETSSYYETYHITPLRVEFTCLF